MGGWIKKHKAVLAVSLAAAGTGLTLMGVFAWTDRTQRGLNETILEENAGARIHDDWDGRSKDVYAENYSGTDDADTETGEKKEGVPVLVRIRLDEYMESGPDAGEGGSAADRDVTLLVSQTDKGAVDPEDPSTWVTRKPGDTAETNPFIRYWDWGYGGSAVYMPTFNKNIDSLAVDVNGTYEGMAGTEGHYDDHVVYTAGQKVTADAYYDADGDDEDEDMDGTRPGYGGDEGTDFKRQQETHTAARTPEGTVLTMEDWKAEGSPVGNYWVWDTDGWFYWAMPVFPAKTTGLLLDEVRQRSYTSERSYYAINVVGQFATAEDLGTDGEQPSGFYIDGITADGLALLEQASRVHLIEDGSMYADCGANVYRKLLDEGSAGSLICAGEDRTPGTADDRTDVVDRGEDLWVDSVNYGRYFLAPEAGSISTAYRAAGEDGNLGTSDDAKLWYAGSDFVNADENEFTTIGADTVTITTDDGSEVTQIDAKKTLKFKASVTLQGDAIKNQKVTWKVSGGKNGTTISADGLLTVASDEVKGTVLAITAVSDEDRNAECTAYTLTVSGPDEVWITSGGIQVSEILELEQGTSQSFVATVKKQGETYSDEQVDWELTGYKRSGTTLEDGKLTVAVDEPVDQILYVKATSVNDPDVSATIEIRVMERDNIANITPGSTTTVTIDETEFYVLAKNGDETLLYAKDPVAKSAFGTGSGWSESCTLYQTMVSWLNGKPTLSRYAIEKTIYTRAKYNNFTNYNEMTCKVFALSQADVFGTVNGGADNITEDNKYKEYTYNGERLISNKSIMGFTNTTYGSIALLRSPLDATGVSAIGNAGNSYNVGYSTAYAVRPALWVKGL